MSTGNHHIGRSRATVLLIGLALSACGGVLETASGTPGGSASAIGSSGATASSQPTVLPTSQPSPLGSTEPTPIVTPVPTPRPAAVLSGGAVTEGSIAAVTVDGLNLRVSPSTSAKSIGLLDHNAELYVTGPPKDGATYRWYPVAVVFGPYSGLECHIQWCNRDNGWVASPLTGAAPWLADAVVDCPTSPKTIDALAQLDPLERLHCFGQNELTLVGWMDTPCCGYWGIAAFDPVWLGGPDGRGYFITTNGTPVNLQVRTAPDLSVEAPQRGSIIRVTGHFDDPVAATCLATPGGDGYSPGQSIPPEYMPNKASAVLTCRTEFVISKLTVIGFKMRSGCGCSPPNPWGDVV